MVQLLVSPERLEAPACPVEAVVYLVAHLALLGDLRVSPVEERVSREEVRV